MHFPKAAGSSIIHTLRSHYGDALLTDYSHPPPLNWSNDPVCVPAGIRSVCGHFHANRYVAYRTRIRFTFLREPVENLISIYYFWRTFPPSRYPAHERFLSEQPTIFDFARYPEIQTLASTVYFGGVDLSELDFVGFFERRIESLARLSALTGIPFDAAVHVNRTGDAFDRDRHELKADRSAMARLRQTLREDVRFYEKARERFD